MSRSAKGKSTHRGRNSAPRYQSCLPCSLLMKSDSGFSCPPFAIPVDCPRGSVLLCLTAEYGSSSPGVPECPEFIDTVVTTSLFFLSSHKVLESRGSSLQDLQILHHSTWAVVALADIPSHGFSSQRTLWHPGPALSPPLFCPAWPAQPPVGLRDPKPSPPSR